MSLGNGFDSPIFLLWTNCPFASDVPQVGIDYAVEMREYEPTAVTYEADVFSRTKSALEGAVSAVLQNPVTTQSCEVTTQ